MGGFLLIEVGREREGGKFSRRKRVSKGLEVKEEENKLIIVVEGYLEGLVWIL